MTDTDQKSDPPHSQTDSTSETSPGISGDAAPKRRLAVGWAVAAVLAVIVVAAAVVLAVPSVRAWLGARLAPERAAAPDQALTERIAALEKEIAGLRTAAARPPAAAPVDGGRLNALDERVAALADTVRKVEAGRPDPGALTRLDERLARLEQRLDALAAERADAAADRVALLAFIAALDAGRPFAAFLPAARARLGAMGEGGKALAADLDALAPLAQNGVPTAAALAVRVSVLRLVPAEVAAKAQPAAGAPEAGLWARVKASIAGLVKIRRVDDAPEAARADLAPLRAALAAGDLDAAGVTLASIDSALTDASRAALDALARDLAARRSADRLARALDTAIAAPRAPQAAPATAP